MGKINTKARRVALHEVETFDFSLDSDERMVYHLPLFQHLPIKAVRDLARKPAGDDDAAARLDLVIDLFDRYAPGLTDEISQADIQSILEAWNEASEVSLGE